MTLKSTPIGHIDVHMEIRGSGSVNNEQHGCEIAPDRRPGLCTESPGGALAGTPMLLGGGHDQHILWHKVRVHASGFRFGQDTATS